MTSKYIKLSKYISLKKLTKDTTNLLADFFCLSTLNFSILGEKNSNEIFEKYITTSYSTH